MFIRFARQTRTQIKIGGVKPVVSMLDAVVLRPGALTVISFEGTVDYEEIPPPFHDTGWAYWWAFRLLHPVTLHNFDADIRALFEDHKSSGRRWATYNEEKRQLLADYLQMPYGTRRKRTK